MSEKESVSSISSIGKYFLSHPFQDFPSIPENSTQNLMDYADGQQLRKYQWDDIHNLRDVELYGQDEEGNAAIQNLAYGGYFDIKKEEWGNYGYLSPVGAAIVVPGATHLKFNEDGAVINFILNGKIYYGVHSVSSQRFLGYLSEDDKSILTEHHLLTAEFEAEFNQKKFKGIEYLENEKTIVAIAKKKYQKAYLDCAQKAFWKNQKQASNYTGIAKPPFIPDYAFVVDWKGSQCSDYEKDGVGNGVGVDVYLALINEISDEQKPELVELANYLTDLLKDKKFAFYGSGLEDIYMSGSFNPETLKYFRDNKIYSKVEFETQFPHQITKARYYDYIFSEKDLWAGIKPDYNRASTDYKIGGQYKYSLSDLITREKYFRDENVFKTAIEKFENDGNAQPISVKDGYDQDLARYGSDSALFGFTKYASSVAEAPMKAYMAYRFGPEILKQYLKSVSEDATSKFLKGASIEFASQYIAEEAFGIEMKIPELILDMVSSGLKEVYTPENLYAEMAVDCIIGIDIFDLLSKIENDQNIDFLDLGIQCVIPAVSGPVFKIASNKAGKFFNMKSFKLIRVLNFIEKFGIKDKGKYIFELCGIDKLEKRGIKYKDVMSNILSTAKGAKAFDFLADVKFDINRLSAENFQRLTNVIDKYGVDKQFKDFFTGSKDVNRMLSVMENSGETLGEYMRFIEKVSNDPKMFAGTITISGKKMKFSEFFNDIDDAYSYYHEVGTKYRYISKFHELSNIGILILVKDGIGLVGKVSTIKSVKEINDMIKNEEKK